MSSPFAQKFFGKKPFTSKAINPEAGDKDYEAIGDAARRREQELSAESGDTDYEVRLKVQKELAEKKSPLNGAYASGAGGVRYVSTAGAFQRLQDDISAGIQANLANRKAKKAAEAEAAKKAAKKQKKFKESTKELVNKDYSLDVPKFEATSISEFDKKNNDNLFYQ